MQSNEKTPQESFLASVSRRAKGLLTKAGLGPHKGVKRRYVRSEVDANEKLAHKILDQSKYGPCAELARNMVDIAVSVDNHWVELFPVFEVVDEAIQKENCTFEATPQGYELRDSAGRLISSGASLRLFLAATAYLQSGQVVLPYDRQAE